VTVIDAASDKALKSIKTGRYPGGVVSGLTPVKAADTSAPK
jgi:hypothetical protein